MLSSAKPLKNAEDPKPDISLKTYNVTKADARPRISEHHKILFDEKKILVPWEEGKTSHLCLPAESCFIGYRKESS